MIPYGRQHITDEDIKAVVDVLKSDFLTQGSTVPEFERAVCDYTGVRYAAAVNSGTSALHIACLALGLAKGDYLWTTPVTFVASANCGLYCGARVDFIDIDPVTWNISIDRLKEKLKKAKQDDRLPKVIVAVHLCGLPCDMEAIHFLSKEYGFNVIEDASHAIGSKYLGQPIGNCKYSDIAVFSFHPVKTITTGEGGMALTNDNTILEKMQLFRSHGITRDPEKMTQEADGSWYYQQIYLGFNYRMTDIQAALGISQLKRLNEIVERRNAIADRYDNLLAGLSLQLPCTLPDSSSARHLYIIRVDSNSKIIESMREQGVGVNVHYIPVHTQPYYQQMGFAWGDFPQAESYYKEAISLPIFPDLHENKQDVVVKALKKAIDLQEGK